LISLNKIKKLTYQPRKALQAYFSDCDSEVIELLINFFGDPKSRYNYYRDILANPFFKEMKDGPASGKVKSAINLPRFLPKTGHAALILATELFFRLYQPVFLKESKAVEKELQSFYEACVALAMASEVSYSELITHSVDYLNYSIHSRLVTSKYQLVK